jgi:hypothetical protein
MNGTGKLSNVTKVIIVAVIAAALIIWVIVYSTNNGGSSTALNSNTNTGSIGSSSSTAATTLTANGSPAVSATEKSSAPASAPATTPSTTPTIAPAITFVTPVANDVWTIGDKNLISWNAAPNVTGAISLLSAATGKSIGVILPEIGPKQTSYTWDTVGVYLNRTDPQETDIVPGNYKIEVSFDGNNLGPIVSSAFTITN